MNPRIYLDNAATTRIAPEVLEAMLPYLRDYYGNPSAFSEEGRQARYGVETSRKSIASKLNCKPGEIIFTSCGTEANNLALRGAVRSLGIREIITSRIEHHAVLNTVRDLAQNGEVKLNYVALLPDGSVDLSDLQHLLVASKGKTLVSLMHANNETGMLLDLKEAGAICKKHGALLHSDCVQTIGHLPIDLSALPVDMISGSGHKFHGPKGIGILFVREGLPLRGVITGGSQERGIRAGTENVAGTVGFARALDLALQQIEADTEHLHMLKQTLKTRLAELGCAFNGDADQSLGTVLSVRFPKNNETENILFELDRNGISASGGSACNAGKGSHVMEVIGARDYVNVRFSFSRYNSIEDILKLVTVLETRVFCYSKV